MRENNIDTLRFSGAFFVLVGHAFAFCYGPGGGEDPLSNWLKSVTAYQARLPGIGVALFFVLSGYLVTGSYLSRGKLLVYLEARALRIFPALWVILLLTVFCLGPLVTELNLGDYLRSRGTWDYLLHNFKLFPDIRHRLPGVFNSNPWPGVNGSLWTLPVEVRMYLIVALMGVLRILHRRWLFNLAAAFIVGWYLLLPDSFFLLQKIRHERLGVYFLLGALLYINRVYVPYHWAGVVLLSFMVWAFFKHPGYNLVYAVWFSYLVMYIALHSRIRLPDLGGRGDFSYGLYLYAAPVTQLGVFYFGGNHPWLMVVFTFLCAMTLAVCSWYLVERPALRLKGRLMLAPAAPGRN